MKMLNMQGTQMPALGFGTWQLTGEQCIRSTRNAIDIGYRHIDTAQIYENEAEVGQAIAESSVPRNQLFVTTKLWTTHFTEELVASSLEESLRKLRMDYVDLLLIHWPNPDVPLEETLTAMMRQQQAGKVRHIGVSNFPVKLMREALETHGAPIACNQVEYHALLPQRAVLEYAQAHDIIVTAYSPLARGRLGNHPVLEKIGRKYNKSANQVALRWLIEQKGVAAIPKAASEKNARANFDIFDFELDEADKKDIAAMAENKRLINPGWSPQWDAA